MSQLVPVLSLRQVQFSWVPEQAPLISVEALTVQPGESVFIAGPSGSGKSTLLSLIGGITVPQNGRIVVLGEDQASLSGAARDRLRADNLGIIFQQFNLVPYLSVLENVMLSCQFSAARRNRLAAAGVTPHQEAQRLLQRLGIDRDDLLNRNATDLSIGQQQRVAVARALIGNPSIIIADEPTSALDEGTRERFMSLLFEQCRAIGAAMLFVSHDTRLAGLFDRKISLSDINQASQ